MKEVFVYVCEKCGKLRMFMADHGKRIKLNCCDKIAFTNYNLRED